VPLDFDRFVDVEDQGELRDKESREGGGFFFFIRKFKGKKSEGG